jgi:hypothetical protein
MFANNVGVQYLTPEQVFKQVINYVTPLRVRRPGLGKYIGLVPHMHLPAVEKALVIMCGLPCAGKTHISQVFGMQTVTEHGYEESSLCVSLAKDMLRSGSGVLIDGCMLTKKARAKYISLGRKYSYTTIIIHVDNDLDFCYYANNMRCELTCGSCRLLPRTSFYAAKEKIEIPCDSECDAVVNVTNKLLHVRYMFPPISTC